MANQPQEPPEGEGQSQVAVGRGSPGANERNRLGGSQNLAQGAAAAAAAAGATSSVARTSTGLGEASSSGCV